MKITVRPATAFPKIMIHRKVAAYCRVSTQQEIQHHSLEAQREYYEKRITSNPGWEFVDIYADEASGSNNRKQRMVLSLAYMAQQSHAYTGRDCDSLRAAFGGCSLVQRPAGASRLHLLRKCTPEGTRLHFLSLQQKKIEVRLRQAVAGNTPPDSHRICQGSFPFENVGAIIDRPENVPLTALGKVVRQSIHDISSDYAKLYPSAATNQYGS